MVNDEGDGMLGVDADHDASSSSITSHSIISGEDDDLRQPPPVLRSSTQLPCTPNVCIASQQPRRVVLVLRLLRIILLDVPLLATLLLWGALYLTRHCYDTYWHRLMELQAWPSDDAVQMHDALTYFDRPCQVSDHDVAHDMNDLVVLDGLSSLQVMAHNLRHGATLFPNVLSASTASALRDYVLHRNAQNRDMIEVIANEQRASFFMPPLEHDSIGTALHELFGNTSSTFMQSIFQILGPDPAVLDLSTITSRPGAKAQHWHRDVPLERSAMKYQRSWLPTYSLFIPLQNTTRDMGASELCPGTHFCQYGEMYERCIHGSDHVDGHWPAGYGLLMNQQLPHRGGAHVRGPDRVMLIITLAPSVVPRKQVETRRIPTGGSWSAHWTVFGHTTRDLAQVATRMPQPWQTLRGLGMWHHNANNVYDGDGRWGHDFVTQKVAQLSHQVDEILRDDFAAFIRNGAFRVLPMWLYDGIVVTQQRGGDDDSGGRQQWIDLYLGTLRNIVTWTRRCHAGLMALYTTWIILCWCARGHEHGNGRSRRAAIMVRRLLGMHVLVACIVYVVQHKIARSDWARHIVSGRTFALPPWWRHQQRFGEYNFQTRTSFPATLPHNEDVLITHALASPSLGAYQYMLEYAHPGNVAWKRLIDLNALHYYALPRSLQRQLAALMVHDMRRRQAGRLLAKNLENDWGVLPAPLAYWVAHEALLRAAHSTMAHVLQHVDILLSDARYGYWAQQAIARHGYDAMETLKAKFVTAYDDRTQTNRLIAGLAAGSQLSSLRMLPSARITAGTNERLRPWQGRATQPSAKMAGRVEPRPDAWLQQGDLVEAYHHDMNVSYLATIRSANADQSTWHVDYYDGDVTYDLCQTCVTRFVPYEINEMTEFRGANDDRPKLTRIVDVYEDDKLRYDIELVESGKLMPAVHAMWLRHYYDDSY